MPALSDLTQSVNLSAGGGLAASLDGIPLFIGYASGGTPGTVYSFGDVDTLKSTLVSGPVVEASARVLPGLCYVVTVASDVAGAAGTVAKVSGTGAVTPTVTGTPVDNLDLRIKIVNGGAVSTATFQWSLDAGSTWSPVYTTAATFVLVGTGVTAAFGAGTYVAGDVFGCSTTAPGFSTSALTTAWNAYINSTFCGQAEFVHVVGSAVDAAGSATLATALQSLLTTSFAAQNYMSGLIELPDLAAATVATGMATVDAYLVNAVGGYCTLISPISGKSMKRPAAHAIVRRAAKVKPHRHIGAVADGGLEGVTAIAYDERATPVYSAARITSLRTRPPQAGFYVEASKTLISDTTNCLSDWHSVRVLLKAMRIAGGRLQKYVNGDWDLNADGTLLTSVADAIENEVQALLDAGLSGNCSRVIFALNRSNKLALTNTLAASVTIQVKGYSTYVTNTVSAVRTITTT